MIEKLVRKNILGLKPYVSARSLYNTGCLMDANENPYNPFGADLQLNRYPDTSNKALRKALSEPFDYAPEYCAVGNGSDELIDILIRIFCNPGNDEILISSPTYGVYAVFASTNDVVIKDVPLFEFQLDVKGIKEAVTEKTKIIFICSPNNPTANTLNAGDILEIANSCNVLVVVDEAYAEFMEVPSLVSEVKNFENLVILRTLSKAYALAGARLGYCFASPKVIELIQKVKLPYNVNELTTAAVLKALQNRDKIDGYVLQIKNERARMAEALKGIPNVVKVFPSEANFILFQVNKADYVFEQLVEQDIIIRSRTTAPQLKDCLRVTIGSREENSRFIEVLRNITSKFELSS